MLFGGGYLTPRTGLGASALVAPMAPIENRPETATRKNKAAQFPSDEARTATKEAGGISGTPRQPPGNGPRQRRMVRVKSMRVEKKASSVARVLARIRPDGEHHRQHQGAIELVVILVPQHALAQPEIADGAGQAQERHHQAENGDGGIGLHADGHHEERDRGAGEGQGVEGELAHLRRHRQLLPERPSCWPRVGGSSLRAHCAWPLVQRACCARQAAAVWRQFTRHFDVRQHGAAPAPQHAAHGKVEIFGQRIAGPAAGLLDRQAIPHRAVPLNDMGRPARKRASCSTAKCEIQQHALHARQPVGAAVGMTPARLHEARPAVGDQRRHGAAQEIRRRHEVGIEDGHEGRIAMRQAEGQIAGLEALAVAPPQQAAD